MYSSNFDFEIKYVQKHNSSFLSNPQYTLYIVIQSSGLIVDMVALVEGNFGGIIDICIYMNQLLKALKNSPF